MQFFHSDLLQSLEKEGCDISFTDDSIFVQGKEVNTKKGIKKLQEAIKGLSNLFIASVCIPRRSTQMVIQLEANNIESDMNVCCIIDTIRRNVTFYGKTIQDVTKAKVRLDRCVAEQNPCQKAVKLEKEWENVPSMNPIERQFSWSSDAKKFVMFATDENVEIKVYGADILSSLPVDCIVNAANVNLAHGGGVAKAIAKATGKDLTQEGYEYLKTHGKLKVGEACFTRPGKLPYKLVIHAVGPCWSDYAPHSQDKVDKCELAIYNAVINSLSLAEREGMKTIAFPAISSGIFGCPAELCCVQYGKAVLHYSQLSKYLLREIHFVDKNLGIISLIQEAFAAMIPAGKMPRFYNKEPYTEKKPDRDQNTRKDKSDVRHGHPPSGGATGGQKRNIFDNETAGFENINKAYHQSSNNMNVGERTFPVPLPQGYPYIHDEKPPGHHIKSFSCHLAEGHVIYVYSANLLTLRKVEMIACGDITTGNGHGAVTKKLMELGGKQYKKAKKTAFRSKFVTNGSVVICNGGNSNFRFVAHAILMSWNKLDTDKERWKAVTSIYTELFDGMKKFNCHSLALPLLRTGIGNWDPTYCAERLLESLMIFCSRNKPFKVCIHLVNIESGKTQTAIEVIKRIVKTSLKESVRTMSISDRQKQKHSSDSNQRKLSGRPLSGPSYIKSEPHILVHGSKIHDSRRIDEKYRTSNNTLGFVKRRAKTPSPQRHMASSRKTSTEPQRISDSSHSEDEDQSYVHKDPELGDVNSCSDKAESDEPVKGNLKIFEDSKIDRQTYTFGNDKKESTKCEERQNDDDESDCYVSEEESDKDDNNREDDFETCVICMEDITKPQKLSCGHVFCADCIQEQFTYKGACPCGKVCGIIKGDQPYGRMDVATNDRASCAGFEGSGRIEITYKFPDGTQEDNHPCPGARYKGITRTAYLPNNRRGREICDMLKVAFKRKLVFTIGRSRTTGADGVITWNDIHHKTDPKPNSQFGYPDPTYLDRVTEELEVKGVTVKDIPTHHAARPRHR